jgi:hypothetical protein
MKFEYGKFGLKQNPIGAHVTATYKGRTLLGEVTDVRCERVTGNVLLTVRHFNGELWPFIDGEVVPSFVDVLERTYEQSHD